MANGELREVGCHLLSCWQQRWYMLYTSFCEKSGRGDLINTQTYYFRAVGSIKQSYVPRCGFLKSHKHTNRIIFATCYWLLPSLYRFIKWTLTVKQKRFILKNLNTSSVFIFSISMEHCSSLEKRRWRFYVSKYHVPEWMNLSKYE